MQVNVHQTNKDTYQSTLIDKLAICLSKAWDGETNTNRLFRGFHSIPYLGLSTNNLEVMDVYYDEKIDGVPHMYGWRFWGEKAELLYQEISASDLDLFFRPQVTE